MGDMQTARRTPIWFMATYWSLVAVGVVAVVLAFTVGSAEQRIWTGTVVFIGVVILTVARFLVRRPPAS
ncbi:hypothetical protein M3147_08775 [Agromyces mediolanus]|uniref:hypothetical protein n=1 Tax=Agromyces mediolanus TaxID=41986 RepID=UPI00203B2F95|nr:hypothetical protein [Agromyces mediolanus]MCM3657343.1 hypothetical protein [Agromyces mediolanus]